MLTLTDLFCGAGGSAPAAEFLLRAVTEALS